MAIYQNEDGPKTWYTYFCFACKATGHVPKNEVASWLSDVVEVVSDKPRPQLSYYWEDSIPVIYAVEKPHGLVLRFIEDEGVESFFKERNICPEVLSSVDIRYNVSRHALVWECLTETQRVKSGQVRFLDKDAKPKIIHVDSAFDPSPHYSRYAYVGEVPQAPRPLVVAESYLDALSLRGADLFNYPTNIMSVLSTNFNKTVIGVVNYLASMSNGTIIICMDTDTPGQKAGSLFRRYLTPLGYRVILMTDRLLDIRDSQIVKPYHERYHEAFNRVVKECYNIG
jgi:hypothetical protein